MSEVEQKDTWRQMFAKHPMLVALSLFFLIVGAISGAFALPDEWSLGRRVLGGGLMGIWCGLLVTATRLMGMWEGED